MFLNDSSMYSIFLLGSITDFILLAEVNMLWQELNSFSSFQRKDGWKTRASFHKNSQHFMPNNRKLKTLKKKKK